MRIEKIVFRNFGSYGNRTIDLDIPVDPAFVLISGKNGHGKSTLSDVIKFAIYGKLESKKLKDMANRLNKNAYVKIFLSTSKGKVTIERGIEPGFFNLEVNGKPFDKAGKRTVQEYLEEELIEMPFYVFSNTLSLSINDFKSFLKMSNSDKKAIIDKIFGLQVLNQMRELVKQQTKKLKEGIDQMSASINAFSKSLETSKNELDKLEEILKADNTSRKAQLLEQKGQYEVYIEKCTSNMTIILEKLKTSNDARSAINTSMSADRQICVSSQEKIQLYQNSKCPMCEADFDTDFHKDAITQYTAAYDEALGRITEKEETLKKVKENIQKLETLRTETTSNSSSAKTKLNYANIELNGMKDTVDDLQMNSLKKILEDSQKNIEENKEQQTKQQKGIAFYGLVEEILGDKGVKQMAIKSILPPLNAEIGKIIKALGIDHKIVFDEEFDAKISHFGIEVSPDTLSTGEMKKVDFAVLLAVIRMMKMKYPFLNLLFLDEIFSSIDHAGQLDIVDLLGKMVKELNMNIFVISHYPLSLTAFDYTINVTKDSGFSTFDVIKNS